MKWPKPGLTEAGLICRHPHPFTLALRLQNPGLRTPAQDSVCNRWRRSPGLSKFRCKTMKMFVSHEQLAKKLLSRQLCKAN